MNYDIWVFKNIRRSKINYKKIKKDIGQKRTVLFL